MSKSYAWGLIHGAERVLAPLIQNHGDNYNADYIIHGIRQQIGGVCLARQILTEIEELHIAFSPAWPPMERRP